MRCTCIHAYVMIFLTSLTFASDKKSAHYRQQNNSISPTGYRTQFLTSDNGKWELGH